MPFQYSSSSSSSRYLGFEGDRPRQGPVRWSESQECSDSRRSARFSDHLKIKQDEGNCHTEFSPNSVTGHVGRSAVGPPPSPSPVCSPTNSLSPACSPRGTPYAHSRRHGEAYSRTEGSTGPSNRGKRPVGETHGEAVVAGPSSGRSDNSQLPLLATGNMYSNRESKPAPENPEDEDNDEVREIHMTEERSRSANTNNQIIRRPRQQNWSDTSMGSFISSDGESISLSTEFNNVLAAAAAAGTNNSAQAAAESERLRNILEEVSPTRRGHLPGIGEEEPTRSDERDQTENNINRRDRDSMALVLSTDNNHTTSNNTAAPERNPDQRGGRDYLALVPMNGTHESSGSNSDRDAPMSSWDSQNNENERAVVNHGESSGDRNGSTSSNSVRNWKDKGGQVATPKQLALAKVKRDKIEAKAVAWEEAKTAEVDNRFKREESITMAWENEQKVKANIKMKKVERKLEDKRAKAFEKMQNEIARAHRKAEERRAVAEAKKGAENAKITEAVEKIRAFGRLPRKFLIF
ncbi:remorin 4.1 [Cryptomeria japonica]|uniref:remorin 4.1 n=1 Tax=Cryptomeria japonica TaxID=3369 RepID=UPI0027DAA9E6|nr:remorin 4.1 [Cryptomeria japonica]